MEFNKNAEAMRLRAAGREKVPWRKWGPYLSERQWGTVREDYSENGDAWSYFSHDQARSRAYRWGEDGIAGISDDHQILCFALALWNGNDPILKERLYGVTNSEGNHGEDVKEYYFYVDSTPTHSYMKYLYKYPQAAFPYAQLWQNNKSRTRDEMEYELLDTGVFDEDRYFDVFVEYAKASTEDVLVRITVVNRGPDSASLHVLPHLWFRNTWSWTPGAKKPALQESGGLAGASTIQVMHDELGERWLYCEGDPALLFTENETNYQRVFNTANPSPYVKDAINDHVVMGTGVLNPKKAGTKAAAHYTLDIGPGETKVIRLRLSDEAPTTLETSDIAGEKFDAVFAARKNEADAFYNAITPPALNDDQRNVMRQALAGMLWGKQYYFFDLDRWLEEHQAHPLLGIKRPGTRNRNWFHMINDDVISMPDKWEYPWYAAWDLAFHTIALNMVDPGFARSQLDLMLSETYLHPNGQIPAYEWNFSDVNPPVHAWATLFSHSASQQLRGEGDRSDLEYLKSAFQKLLLNFTWWVNRKDPGGRNVFEGGFLGLDNIGVFDRSAPLPTGGYLEQADGTAWMALFSQNMLELATEIAQHDPTYHDMVLKFLQHFLWIAAAMDRIGNNQDELWDEEDGFFYDVLRLPNGSAQRLKVRSLVGLLPLCATTTIPAKYLERFPDLVTRMREFLHKHEELVVNIAPLSKPGVNGARLLSVLNEEKLRRVLSKMLDENEFLGPHGIRALSKIHEHHPFTFNVHGQEFKVQYLPAESNTGMFGGNSNWRGPVWMPVNLLLIRALIQSYLYYGDDFKIECPTGSGQMMTLFEVAREISDRLSGIFLRGKDGKRPVYGGAEKFQTDPHWRDYILFYEYFHGDNGAGLGASHQTGWTGVVARMIQLFGYLTPEDALKQGGRPLAHLYWRSE
jgi:hypothetical protein